MNPQDADPRLLDILTDIVVFVSPTLVAGNEDDEIEASKAVDAFLEQYEPGSDD